MPQIKERVGLGVPGVTGRAMASSASMERIYVGTKPVKVVNDNFLNNVDVKAVVGAAEKKKKLLVVGQFPEAGELVPAGTPVKLVMMYKEAISVGSFRDLSNEMKVKYSDKHVIDVLNDIEGSTAAKAVLETEKEYGELNEGEKDAFDKYAKEKNIISADASDESKKKVYKDLYYMYNF